MKWWWAKLTLLLVTVLAGVFAFAATTDFTADSNITVPSVTGDVTANMIIFSGSQAESWNYDGGIFTVTNANGSTFKVGSSDASVLCLKVNTSLNALADQTPNTTPGVTSLTIPTGGTYIVYPSGTACSSSPPVGGGGGGGGGGGS